MHAGLLSPLVHYYKGTNLSGLPCIGCDSLVDINNSHVYGDPGLIYRVGQKTYVRLLSYQKY